MESAQRKPGGAYRSCFGLHFMLFPVEVVKIESTIRSRRWSLVVRAVLWTSRWIGLWIVDWIELDWGNVILYPPVFDEH